MANPIRNLGEAGVPVLCGHIKNLRNIVYLMGNAFQETMSEIEEAINDYPVASSISVSTEGWKDVTPANSMGDYGYYYDIAFASVDESDLPIVSVAPDSIAVSANCGLCQTCQSLNGKIRLFSKVVPESVIHVSCWVIKGQTAAEKTTAMNDIENWDVMTSVTGGQS